MYSPWLDFFPWILPAPWSQRSHGDADLAPLHIVAHRCTGSMMRCEICWNGWIVGQCWAPKSAVLFLDLQSSWYVFCRHQKLCWQIAPRTLGPSRKRTPSMRMSNGFACSEHRSNYTYTLRQSNKWKTDHWSMIFLARNLHSVRGFSIPLFDDTRV